MILKNQGKVVLKLPKGYEPLKDEIDKDGQAYFPKIDAELLGDAIQIYIEHDQPYQSLVPDSLYKLERNGVVGLTVQLNNLGQLIGAITDFTTHAPLDSVRVSIHPEVFTWTNTQGEFILNIPPKYQKKFQQVKLYKDGYKSATSNKVPIHTKDRFDTSLEPL